MFLRASTLLLVAGVAAAGYSTVLLNTSFEATESPSFTTGSLDAQNGWVGLSNLDFEVVTNLAQSGSQSVFSDSAFYSSALAYKPFAAAVTSGLSVTTVWIQYDDSTPATTVDNSAFGLEAWQDNTAFQGRYATLMIGADGRPYLKAGFNDAVYVQSTPVSGPNQWHKLMLVVAPVAKTVEGYVNGARLSTTLTGTSPVTAVTDVDLAGYAFGSYATEFGVDSVDGGFNGCFWDGYKSESLPLGTVRGTVNLQNFGGTIAGQPISVEVRDASHAVLETLNTTLDASGTFTVSPTSRGSLFLAIKGSHWLRKESAINLTDMGNFNFATSLMNGDVDGDNEIAPNDFSILSGAFGTVEGDPGFLANADLDGDGEVGPSDFSLLSGGFGETGD